MKRNKQMVAYLLGIIISTTTLNAQILNDNFSNTASWTWTSYGNQTLTPTGPNPGSLQVANNQLEFRGFRGSQNYRLVRPIGSNYETNQAVSYTRTFTNTDTWKFRFELTPVTNNQDNFMIFGLTDKTDHWLRDNTSSSNNTTNSIRLIYSDPTGSNNQLRLSAGTKYQTNKGVNSNPIFINQGTTYYVQIERTSSTQGTLSVFSNSAYSNHVSGSPVTFNINSNLGGLQYVQAATSPGISTQRIGDVDIDNVEIIQTNNLNCDVYANYLSIAIQNSCQEKFYNRSVVGSTEQTYLGSVYDFGDKSFQKIMPGSGIVYHSYPYNSYFYPSITSFSYYKSGGNYYMCRDEAQGNGGWFSSCTVADSSTDTYTGSTPNTYDNCNSMNSNFNYTVCGDELTITNTTTINNDEFLFASVVNFGDGSADVTIPVGQSYTHTYTVPLGGQSTFSVCLTSFGYLNLYANSQSIDPFFIECMDQKCDNITANGWSCPPDEDPWFNRKKAEMENEDYSFAIAPNPVNDQVNITVPSGTQKLVIYDAVGKQVKSIEFPNEGSNFINLESFDNGVYIVTVVRNNGKIENKKLVKQ